jgi:hypothetical protein
MIVAPRLYIVSSFHNASRSNNIVQYVFRATRRRSNELNLPTLVAPFALLYNHRQTSLRPDSRVTMSEVNTCPTTIVAADLSLCSAPFIVNCGKRIAIGSSWLAACCFLFIFFFVVGGSSPRTVRNKKEGLGNLIHTGYTHVFGCSF